MLSLLEHLTIDFPSHFILFLIDVYRDTATHDKLIFLSAITRILCHFSVPFLVSDHFHVMYAIDAATVKRSKAQLRSRRSRTAIPLAATALSTSTPSSSTGGVTLEDIMAQLMRMHARLDTLSDELCQVNTYFGRIARRQASTGGFVASPPPTLEASEDKDDDGNVNASDADKDDGASSSSADKISI